MCSVGWEDWTRGWIEVRRVSWEEAPLPMTPRAPQFILVKLVVSYCKYCNVCGWKKTKTKNKKRKKTGYESASGAVQPLRMISILDFYIGLEKYLLLLCFFSESLVQKGEKKWCVPFVGLHFCIQRPSTIALEAMKWLCTTLRSLVDFTNIVQITCYTGQNRRILWGSLYYSVSVWSAPGAVLPLNEKNNKFLVWDVMMNCSMTNESSCPAELWTIFQILTHCRRWVLRWTMTESELQQFQTVMLNINISSHPQSG